MEQNTLNKSFPLGEGLLKKIFVLFGRSKMRPVNCICSTDGSPPSRPSLQNRRWQNNRLSDATSHFEFSEIKTKSKNFGKYFLSHIIHFQLYSVQLFISNLRPINARTVFGPKLQFGNELARVGDNQSITALKVQQSHDITLASDLKYNFGKFFVFDRPKSKFCLGRDKRQRW